MRTQYGSHGPQGKEPTANGRPTRRRRRDSVSRTGAASMELVMATAVAIPVAGGLLFLGFKICRYVFSVFSGSLSMPFV